eukprot:CAMPEP_0172518664 /NCGR_PEP_ID=MMETSP1066-20121228/290953_1 /TAXON_ID=671091 /ORGANISM="Coscinodiscus wailesii, Strain CCMP2513" /LENGTH=56 /DNA_ID=CAMNT_0013301095 /DNA_START=2042 /DNA_END=2212 /DNA_ORIENTATION=+
MTYRHITKPHVQALKEALEDRCQIEMDMLNHLNVQDKSNADNSWPPLQQSQKQLDL